MTTSRNIYILVEGDAYHAYENIRAFPNVTALITFLREENKSRTADRLPPWKLVEGETQRWTDGTFFRWVEEALFDE